MPAGNCYRNSHHVARSEGGSAQPCWALTWFPGHFVEALHHAVWRRVDGTLVEVTAPPFDNMSEPWIKVIIDCDTKLTPLDPGIPSIVHQIDRNEGTKEYLELTRRRMILARDSSKIVARVGYVVSDEGVSLVNDPPEAFHRLRELVVQIDARRRAYCERFRAGNFDRIP